MRAHRQLPIHPPWSALRCVGWLIAVCITLPQAFSQEPLFRFDRLSIADGLSENGVSCITQDRKGFLWFGTLDGLNRYDGYRFEIFRQQPFDSTTISQNRISSILEDREGNLWVGASQGGVNLLRYPSKIITHFLHRPDDPGSLASNEVTSLSLDSTGSVWVGTFRGLHRWGAPTGSFSCYSPQRDSHSPRSDSILSLITGRDGTLWIGSMGGLDSFSPASGKFVHYGELPQKLGLSTLEVRTLDEDDEEILWIGTMRYGLIRFDRKSQSLTRYHADAHGGQWIGANDIWDIAHAAQGGNRGIWIATGNGLFRGEELSRGRYSFTAIRNDRFNTSSLSGNEVWSLLIDRQGLLWVGTWQDGISVLAPYRWKFEHFTSVPGNPNTLSSSNINALHEDRSGNVWVGTLRTGLEFYDRRRGIFMKMPPFPRLKADPSGWYHRCITSVVEDRAGDLWVSSWVGLFRMNRDRRTFTAFPPDPSDPYSLTSPMINTLFCDSRNRLWIGMRGAGVDVLDLDNPEVGFVHCRYQTDGVSSSSGLVWVIGEGRDGRIWIGTESGLYCGSSPVGPWERFSHDQANRASLAANSVYALGFPLDGTVWVGTTAGLERLDVSAGRFEHFGEGYGLPNGQIYGILPGNSGELWVATNKGLASFDVASGKTRTYSTADGLQGMEFCIGAAHRGRSGLMYFGGLNGYNEFHPDSILSNPHAPSIYITRVALGDSVVVPEELRDRVIVLEYPHYDFTIEFLALDYTDPLRNRYRYMLRGYDREWVDAGNRRQTRYTNIDPGEYVFAVRGANADGAWSIMEATLPITIRPPFWRTIWFTAVVGAIVAGGLFLLYRLRVSRIVAMERMRTRIASDLHDDIGSTLTKIAIQSEIIQGSNDREGIRAASRRIGAASREIITTLSDVVWSIDARNDKVGDLLDRMRDFAAEILGSRQIEYTLTTQGLDPSRVLPVEVRQNLYLIFKEAINNIARHSTARTVLITIANGPVQFTMKVANDGVARDEWQKASGHYGLQNMALRARRIGAELTTEGPPGFTVVVQRRKI